MPGDLFATVAVRPPSVQSRRSPILVVSLGVHVVVLLAVLIGSAIAPGVLPTPREVLAFYEPIRMDIKLPPPPPAPRPPTTVPPSAPAVSANAAPMVPPSAIEPEKSPLEEVTTAGASVVSGVSDGIGAGVVGLADAAPRLVAEPPKQPPRLHSGMTAPIKTVHVAPVYPDVARQTRTKGVVILEAVIDESGIVTSARVLRGHPLLDQAALDAVGQWKFSPARLNNEVIPVVITVTVNFTLN